MLLQSLRKKLCVWLFEQSTKPYAKLFKRKKRAWDITKHEFLHYPEGSLGNELGKFLYVNGFDLIPKLERHDAYHVITNYSTAVESEIALQYFFLGNGKRSLYLFGVSVIGMILLPEYFTKYEASFQHGKSCNPLHEIDIEASLILPLKDIQNNIFNSQNIISWKES